MRQVAANIRRARCELGLTQEQFAHLIGCTGSAVQSWEAGWDAEDTKEKPPRGVPRSTNLLKICEVTGRDWSWFHAENDDDDDEQSVAA